MAKKNKGYKEVAVTVYLELRPDGTLYPVQAGLDKYRKGERIQLGRKASNKLVFKLLNIFEGLPWISTH